jgi:hypothetical protein
MMPEEEVLNPYPSQAESDEMQRLAVTAGPPPPHPVLREGEEEDLTPAMTQAQNDAAVLIAAGPAPGSMPPMVKDVPHVAGAASVGGTLTVTMGNWFGEPNLYAYQWRRDGAANVGTDAASYVVVAADAGHEISCVVTASNDNGSTAAPPSNAVLVAGAARAAR